MRVRAQTVWHDLFEAGVALKALNGAWESIAGALFLFVGPGWFMQPLEPFPFIHRRLHPLTHGTGLFVTAYLLAHGVVNLFLAYQLFRNRLWAYPVAIAFTLLVLVWEVYRVAHTHSPVLLGFALFDPIFIVLTWHEWRYQRTKRLAI